MEPYQVTILQPHKLFRTHILLNRGVVRYNAFAICSRLKNSSALIPQRRASMPEIGVFTSTEHLAVA